MPIWDEATPAGTDPKSQGDDRIREMKVALGSALAKASVFPGPDPSTDPEFYPGIEKAAEASRPAASADYAGRLFINETDDNDIERIADDGSAWVKITKSPAANAIHQKVAQALASVAGVITLPETANAFEVSGSEAVTSIAGWSAGVVTIQWGSARILTHSAGLSIQGSLSRNVVAGDISTFMFTAANTCVEIAHFGAASGYETGASIAHSGATALAGTLEEDGASYLRADYPRLFSRIGTKHGAADGTHFNVPDSRGVFHRGWDHGAGIDPDAAGRTAAKTGGTTGDNVGSAQDDALESHTHPYIPAINNGEAQGGAGKTIAIQTTGNTTATGGNETRPKNIYKMYCIKF